MSILHTEVNQGIVNDFDLLISDYENGFHIQDIVRTTNRMSKELPPLYGKVLLNVLENVQLFHYADALAQLQGLRTFYIESNSSKLSYSEGHSV